MTVEPFIGYYLNADTSAQKEQRHSQRNPYHYIDAITS